MFDNCVHNVLKNLKTNHSQCISLEYLYINSVKNKFYSIPPLIEHNVGIFAIADRTLDSSFLESQYLLEGMKKRYRFDVSNRKGGYLCISIRIFHQNIFEVSIF